MPVTEAQRHRLYEALKANLGPAEADTFMNMLPPTDWNELATKRDLAELRAEFRADLNSEISGLQRTFATWLIASQAGTVAAVGLIVTVVVAFLA